jgi:hypothetical protein
LVDAALDLAAQDDDAEAQRDNADVSRLDAAVLALLP